jgi:NADH:ubiquinone oxidoreductase subunit 6 (subunit J)
MTIEQRLGSWQIAVILIASLGTLLVGFGEWPRPFAAVQLVVTGWLWALAYFRLLKNPTRGIEQLTLGGRKGTAYLFVIMSLGPFFAGFHRAWPRPFAAVLFITTGFLWASAVSLLVPPGTTLDWKVDAFISLIVSLGMLLAGFYWDLPSGIATGLFVATGLSWARVVYLLASRHAL